MPQTATSTPTQAPNLDGLRMQPIDAPETTLQTLKRNLTPEIDTSRSALGVGHEFDSTSPQMEGEQQYREQFGSSLEQAYGHAKHFLNAWEGKLSEKVLAPFRQGLDNISDDLQAAAESGHTRAGGQLTTPARLLVGGIGAGLRMVPIGHDVQSTVAANIVPPEFPEGKALSRELKVGEKAASRIHEPVGIHEDDVPRGSKVPSVAWEEKDLQDSAKTVNEQTIAKDYGPKRKGAKFSVYKSHIPMEDLPSAKIVEEEESDPELRNENWREDYQGILRRTTPPIKVRVNPKGEMEILDGNHRAQLWSDANMTHAPAWVVDERGKGIENLSEDEKAERAEAEEEQNAAQQKAHAPNLSGVRARKPLPPQPHLPDAGTHAAIKTDDGGIYIDDAPEKQRTHIMLAKDLGIPPERVVSGGWLQDGHYEASERSDAGRWGEQARAKAAVAEKRAARAQSELPAPTTPTPEAKARERAANLKGLGIGLTEMAPEDAKNWVGYTNQKSLKVYRGVDDPAHSIEAGDFVTTSRESAQNYGKHVQEMEVSPSELRYVRGHKDGDPKLLDQGGQTELIYAPKKKAGSSQYLYNPEGAQPLADKLGAKVVGSVATGKTSADPYGVNRGPKDLDLRIDGAYDAKSVEEKMRAEGFEPRGSSLVSPKEASASGKPYGAGWNRAESFENAQGQKVQIWHDEPEKPWNIHDLGKDHSIPSDDGYLYHATNHDRAHEIAASGLDVHKPSYGTDQQTWPDGATEKRSYFTKQADHAWQFAPEEGQSALLRMKQDPTIHNRESTGDFYSKKKIPAKQLEVLGDDKQWHPISELGSNTPPVEKTAKPTPQQGMIAYRNGKRITVDPPKKLGKQ